MAEVLASASVMASALAFGGASSDASFLAAGTAPGSSNPYLLVYRATAAYVDGVLPLVACIPSPAAFCRVAWSEPTEASCYSSPLPTGLIAGGLKNGVVAVWDPKEALLETSDSGSDSDIIVDYFCPRDKLQQVHGTTPNLVAGVHDHDNRATAVSDPHSNDNLMLQSEDGRSGSGHGRWLSSFRVIEDYFSPDGPPQPRSLDSISGDLTLPASSAASMVARMSFHSDGPVLGLSFSPTTPHFLASGAANGKVRIWNLINPSAESFPHFEYNEGDNVQISDLSWNALNRNVITSASNVGIKILDISTKSSLIGKYSSIETCSAVEWCPTDKDTMLVASGNCCKIWDVRKVDKPVHQFRHTDPIVSISWSPFEEQIVLACTKEKLLLLNVKKGEIVHEEKTPGKCLAVRWSQHRVDHFALATSGGVEMYRGVHNWVGSVI